MRSSFLYYRGSIGLPVYSFSHCKYVLATRSFSFSGGVLATRQSFSHCKYALATRESFSPVKSMLATRESFSIRNGCSKIQRYQRLVIAIFCKGALHPLNSLLFRLCGGYCCPGSASLEACSISGMPSCESGRSTCWHSRE